jgi:hypothetical protein
MERVGVRFSFDCTPDISSVRIVGDRGPMFFEVALVLGIQTTSFAYIQKELIKQFGLINFHLDKRLGLL